MQMKKNGKIKNINKVHPEVFLLRISHFLGKMKENTFLVTTKKREMLKQVQHKPSLITARNAFTLIELLVVVLIIGILAAIAIPQYEKAVEKSKAANALLLLQNVNKAVLSYYLANGSFPTQFNQLGISIPLTGNTPFLNYNNEIDTLSDKDWSLQLENSSTYHGILLGRISGKYQGSYFYMKYKPNYPGKPSCNERKANSGAKYIFQQPAGSYCQGIMGARFSTEIPASRSYLLN